MPTTQHLKVAAADHDDLRACVDALKSIIADATTAPNTRTRAMAFAENSCLALQWFDTVSMPGTITVRCEPHPVLLDFLAEASRPGGS